MVRYQETPFGRDVDISNSCRSVDTYRRTQAIHLISESTYNAAMIAGW